MSTGRLFSQGHKDYYSCDQLDKEKLESWQKEADEAKFGLEKWKLYSEKYTDNEMSQKLEGTISEKVTSMGKDLAAMQGCTPMDAVVLRHACEALAQCRRVLKYTYMHAYFMKQDSESAKNQRSVFEDRQKQFSTVVDRISEVFELPDAVQKLADPEERVRLDGLVGTSDTQTAAPPPPAARALASAADASPSRSLRQEAGGHL